ncbi:hypothetical protein NDU88_005432 [Pleurodeles waltl]|uniref:Uncharacterized protein n=1 Tax=Pleurodeles waltl TaxID=8319 RepID=A0AAV7N179_PLEWA|nr:hypothetical protein NDU88_005432 [Pleurodeles waltl]
MPVLPQGLARARDLPAKNSGAGERCCASLVREMRRIGEEKTTGNQRYRSGEEEAKTTDKQPSRKGQSIMVEGARNKQKQQASNDVGGLQWKQQRHSKQG